MKCVPPFFRRSIRVAVFMSERKASLERCNCVGALQRHLTLDRRLEEFFQQPKSAWVHKAIGSSVPSTITHIVTQIEHMFRPPLARWLHILYQICGFRLSRYTATSL